MYIDGFTAVFYNKNRDRVEIDVNKVEQLAGANRYAALKEYIIDLCTGESNG